MKTGSRFETGFSFQGASLAAVGKAGTQRRTSPNLFPLGTTHLFSNQSKRAQSGHSTPTPTPRATPSTNALLFSNLLSMNEIPYCSPAYCVGSAPIHPIALVRLLFIHNLLLFSNLL